MNRETEPQDPITKPPYWFRDALAAPRESNYVEVAGTPVHYLRWGDKANPGIVFVHGNGAHAEWFAFIAPLLADRYNVAAMDFSGMGESGWRPDTYNRESFAREIFEVSRDAGMTRPIIVGHSFGGLITLIAGHHYGDQLGGIVIADFGIKRPEEHEEWFEDNPEPRPTRVYPTLEAALERFVLRPDQPCVNRFIFDYIARNSLREVDGTPDALGRTSAGTGWTWKFDPKVYRDFVLGRDLPDILRNMRCKVAIVMGELSWNGQEDTLAFHRELTGGRAPVFTIKDARHHLMLDQPIAFTAAIEAIAATWTAGAAQAGDEAGDEATAAVDLLKTRECGGR